MRPLRVLLVGTLLMLTGCASYYKISDPTTGRDYYAVDDPGTRMGGLSPAVYSGSGSVRFVDLATGKVVTLQNTEVQQVSKEEATLHRDATRTR